MRIGQIDRNGMMNNTLVVDEPGSVRRLNLPLKALQFAFHFELDTALGHQRKILEWSGPVGQERFGTFSDTLLKWVVSASIIRLESNK